MLNLPEARAITLFTENILTPEKSLEIKGNLTAN